MYAYTQKSVHIENCICIYRRDTMNNKYEVLICTGKMEEQLKEHETLLEKLKDLQKAIIEDDYVACIANFDEFSELVKETTMTEDVQVNLNNLETYIRTEALNMGINDLHLILNMCIEDLNLSTRTFNVLKGAGINRVSDLIEIPENQFMKYRKADGTQIHGMGKVCMTEVLDKLQTFGLKLKD